MFEQLLQNLQNLDATQGETLAKSLPGAQDDKKIQAAAAESEAKPDGEGAEKGEAKPDGEGAEKDPDAEGETLTKSVIADNGEEMIDATEVLETLQKSLNSTNEAINTSLPLMVSMMERMGNTIVAQGELLKSMQADRAAALGATGAGRKSQVVVMAKSVAGNQATTEQSEQKIELNDLMIKSNAAYDKGLINGVELNLMDMALNRGVGQLDQELVARVMGAKL